MKREHTEIMTGSSIAHDTAMESTPDSGVEIIKERAAPSLAPCKIDMPGFLDNIDKNIHNVLIFLLLIHMCKAHIQKRLNMIVRKRVVNYFAVTSGFNDIQCS